MPNKLVVPVRITRKKRCPEGFYLIINGSRVRFKTRALAIEAASDWCRMQRVQVVSVRDYARRLKKGSL
jgi:hypothetical protein